MVGGWLAQNFNEFVVPELERVLEEMDIHQRELLVELDFFSINSIAPALQTPRPKFKIGVTKDYLEGSSPEFPAWCKTEATKKDFFERIQRQYGILRDKECLIIYRAPGSGQQFGTLRSIPQPNSGA